MKNSEYYIHDNGGCPFIVSFDETTAIVKRLDNDDSDIDDAWKQVLEYVNYKKIFVGKDIRHDGVWTLVYDSDEHTIHGERVSDVYTPCHGNSILINTTDNKYTYIGSEIYEFETNDNIVDYFSPIGNSDVPYPYAVGTLYTYLMLEKKYVLNSLINITHDPYRDYYDLHEIVTGLKYMSEQLKLKREGKEYDSIIDIDDDERRKEEEKEFNIPVSTLEDERKYINYRVKKFNIDKKYLDQINQYEPFYYKIVVNRL